MGVVALVFVLLVGLAALRGSGGLSPAADGFGAEKSAAGKVEAGGGRSRISSTFAEALRDENGDGLAETLVLSPTVTVAVQGTYTLVGHLVDSTGTEVSNGRGKATMAAGAQPIALDFDATYIYRTGRPGPYRLVDLSLFAERTGLKVDAELSSANETAPYDLTVFQHERMSFDPTTFTGAAVDDDRDGVMDRWSVEGTVTVEEPGSYTFSSGLVAAGNAFIADQETTYVFTPGTNPFTIDFDGPAIIASGKPGPYTLWLPSLRVADGSVPRSSVLAAPDTTYFANVSLLTSVSFMSGSGTVEVWERFKPDGSSNYGDWARISSAPVDAGSIMLSVDLSGGLGSYGLYTVAIDGLSGSREAAPPIADATTQLVVGGTSLITSISVADGPSRELSIAFTATYPSGSGSVDLFQHPIATGGEGLVATAASSPISIHVLGAGSFCFHTVAIDGRTGARQAIGPRDDVDRCVTVP
jgi:hypothetical protein